MSYELDRLCREKDEAFAEIYRQIENTTIQQHLSQVKAEYDRQNQFSGQAGARINRIDIEFEKKTNLTSTDIILLFLSTSLQCFRQYLITNDSFRLSAISSEKIIKDPIKSVFNGVERGAERIGIGTGSIGFYKQFFLSSVPYDATNHLPGIITNVSGTTHRYRTAGHDPVLGWIFGTANILSNSLTHSDLVTSYSVKDNTITGLYPAGTIGVLVTAAKVVEAEPKMLPAALMKQMIHFGSDFFTKQSLPIPLLGTLNPDIAHRLMFTRFKDCPQVDLFSLGRQTALSSLINQIIYYVHQLFYQGEKEGTPEEYEIRTRKILSYSNLLATGSNIVVTSITKKMTQFDIGGMLVTLYRLVSDYRFINEVKREFLEKEFYKQVVGEAYDFMKEDKYV